MISFEEEMLMFDILDRMANSHDTILMYEKRFKPYKAKELPNFRRTRTCFNCRFNSKMFCGSHTEWGCGIVWDEYVSKEDGVCDLHKYERED